MIIADKTFNQRLTEFENAAEPHVGVILIDEPAAFGDLPLLGRQSDVLVRAVVKGWPIWFITIADTPTHATLRNAAPNARVFSKPQGNAFEVADFRVEVARSGVTHLIVMGHAANHCVKQTVIGGSWRPNDVFQFGATGYTYQVHTCDDLLSGGPANWKAADRVNFYSELG